MQHDFIAEALAKHHQLKGKIETVSKAKISRERDLSVYYTPGVGAVSSLLADQPAKAKDYTIKSNTIAVISDGSAVLGLGNIGPIGALPVMEGKAMLFKELADVDAFPICLDTQDPKEIIKTIKNIAPVFAGINLEDIAAPKCFEIEKALQSELKIPVIHDDQHATAIAVLAGLINAIKIINKEKKNLKIVILGAGAAGNGVAKLLNKWGVKDIILVDSKGIISRSRKDLDVNKIDLLRFSNKNNISGDLHTAVINTDVVIGLSSPGILKSRDIKLMSKNPIVFAMANPVPEIDPIEAKKAGAAIVATGRSDYHNQINNVLVFPGMFKGAIKIGVNKIDDTVKIRAAKNIASLIKKPKPSKIIPSVFDKNVVEAVASAFQ